MVAVPATRWAGPWLPAEYPLPGPGQVPQGCYCGLLYCLGLGLGLGPVSARLQHPQGPGRPGHRAYLYCACSSFPPTYGQRSADGLSNANTLLSQAKKRNFFNNFFDYRTLIGEVIGSSNNLERSRMPTYRTAGLERCVQCSAYVQSASRVFRRDCHVSRRVSGWLGSDPVPAPRTRPHSAGHVRPVPARPACGSQPYCVP